jgi:aspartyl/asparaginyl beta-hydroxylase (cupin superfamily)
LSFNPKRSIKYILGGAALVALLYFVPVVTIGYIACGFWDVSRNRDLNFGILRQYFLLNGITTWLLSPLNILFDLLSLPFVNKGVYKLEDLPLEYQDELRGLFKAADTLKVGDLVDKRTSGLKRAMYFFKWYGTNVEGPIDVAEFHRDFKFVRTIGVSLFRERENTSRHFGPLRPSLRVLYCLNDDVGEQAYIKVGPIEHHWRDEKLFIFDDTLLHQSFNESDDRRLVLFVDVIRPSYLPWFFDLAVAATRQVFRGSKGVFYRNWKLVND